MESENGPAKMLNQHGEMLQMCTISVIGLVYENAQTILAHSEDTYTISVY